MSDLAPAAHKANTSALVSLLPVICGVGWLGFFFLHAGDIHLRVFKQAFFSYPMRLLLKLRKNDSWNGKEESQILVLILTALLEFYKAFTSFLVLLCPCFEKSVEIFKKKNWGEGTSLLAMRSYAFLAILRQFFFLIKCYLNSLNSSSQLQAVSSCCE